MKVRAWLFLGFQRRIPSRTARSLLGDSCDAAR